MKLFLFGIFYLFFSKFDCQQKIKIVAKDESSLYKKKLLLVPAVHGKYYKNFVEDSANLIDGNYTFKHLEVSSNTLKPYKLVLEIEKNKSYSETEAFFLPSISNVILFNSETGKIKQNENEKIVVEQKKLTDILSQIEKDKKNLDSFRYLSYKKNGVNSAFFKTRDSLIPEYNKLSVKEDSLMFDYSKTNPESYVLLWKVIQKISDNNYNKIYNGIYSNFSKKIKNSEVGVILKTDLISRLKIETGEKFPEIVFDKHYVNKYYGKKYTLVDFWFSYCKPCIEEIPQYKSIHSAFNNKGFEILGISTDRTKDINNWKKIIKKNNIVWKNFLDENGVEAKNYSISQFPTNFLLNSEGIIIKRNITPDELSVFLEKNLK